VATISAQPHDENAETQDINYKISFICSRITMVAILIFIIIRIIKK
jgi:hypothetical protein